jgi:hypothetical protein
LQQILDTNLIFFTFKFKSIMKSIILTLTFIGSMFLLAFTPNANLSTDEKVVVVTIQYKNGEKKVEELKLSAFMKEDTKAFKVNETEVFECTIGFTGGGCQYTAGSCTEAAALFRACACAAGHGKMC